MFSAAKIQNPDKTGEINGMYRDTVHATPQQLAARLDARSEPIDTRGPEPGEPEKADRFDDQSWKSAAIAVLNEDENLRNRLGVPETFRVNERFDLGKVLPALASKAADDAWTRDFEEAVEQRVNSPEATATMAR